jgi:transcriptional regulator with XRE-family HTH domain
VDSKTQIREFLTSRRAKITPDRAGLPVYGGQRRVPGLRREEVALLAGVSVDYYTRLERGNVNGVSDSVLEALANSARYIFLDPRATSLYRDWDRVANDAVAILRSEAGRNPYDRDLSDLVGELSTRSDLFRTLWPSTTSASTTPAPSACTTPSWATSNSPTRPCSSPPTPD